MPQFDFEKCCQWMGGMGGGGERGRKSGEPARKPFGRWLKRERIVTEGGYHMWTQLRAVDDSSCTNGAAARRTAPRPVRQRITMLRERNEATYGAGAGANL